MMSEQNGSGRRDGQDRRNGDRREYTRVPSHAEIRFLHATEPGYVVLEGELQDVSPVGLKLSLTSTVPLRSQILVELNDPGNCCLNLPAVVMWTELLDDGAHHVGCELKSELTIRQQAILRKWIAPAACR